MDCPRGIVGPTIYRQRRYDTVTWAHSKRTGYLITYITKVSLKMRWNWRLFVVAINVCCTILVTIFTVLFVSYVVGYLKLLEATSLLLFVEHWWWLGCVVNGDHTLSGMATDGLLSVSSWSFRTIWHQTGLQTIAIAYCVYMYATLILL